MTAAYYGRINCVDHLITKGANLHALNDVRRGPAAAWRRGLWGTGSERGEAVRRCLRCPARVVLRWRRCAPPLPRRAAASAAGCRPSAARLACKPAGERAAVAVWGAWGGLGGSHPPQAHATHTHPPATIAHPRVWVRRRVSAEQEDGATPGGYGRPDFLRPVAGRGEGRRVPQELGER